MSATTYQILLVAQDDELAEMITQHVEATLHARVRHAHGIQEALEAYATSEPEIVLAEMQLSDGDGLALARQLGEAADRDSAVILMSERATLGRAIEAMRLGVRDLFLKPFDLHRLSYVLDQEAQDTQNRRRSDQRHTRLRRLARQVIRDRRDLRRRVDLVCRDLVHAYRRLAKKVAEQHMDETSDT